MTIQELQTIWKRLYKTLQKERMMRIRVFPPTHEKHEEKLAEINQALADVELLKDALKHYLAQPEQGALFDLPTPAPQRAELL